MSLNTENNKIKDIAEKYALKMLLLFGSQAKGKTNFASDVDVAYLSNKELNGREMIDLNCDLMDVFHSDKIDMVDLKRANPLLRQEIAKGSKLLYGDEIEYLEFKAFAFRDYIGHQPLFELRDFLIKKRQKLLKEVIYGK